MYRVLVFIGIISTSFLFSCKKDLTACIEMDSNVISSGQSITFTSCSVGELSYDWRIAGPLNAPENVLGWSDKVVTIPFSMPGAYVITLNTYSKFSYLGEKETTIASFTVN